MDRNDFSSFNIVGKLPVVNERLNKSGSWSEITFLGSFNTLVGLLYGPVTLLISSNERISLISPLSVGERKKEFGFLVFRLRGNQCKFDVNILF